MKNEKGNRTDRTQAPNDNHLSHEAYEKLFPASKIAHWCQHPDFDRLVLLFTNREGVA